MTHHHYSALVWVLSGLLLISYGSSGLLGATIPGVEDLLVLLQRATGHWLYIAAATSAFLEGLYLVGNFIPGSTIMLLLVILAQTGGIDRFLLTIVAIFVGWSLAGVVNIYGTARLLSRTATPPIARLGHDRFLTTWYPAFRANHEVAEVADGVAPYRVLLSSLRVKGGACIGIGLYALVIPFIKPTSAYSNQESFLFVVIIGFVCISVGVWQWYAYHRSNRPTP